MKNYLLVAISLFMFNGLYGQNWNKLRTIANDVPAAFNFYDKNNNGTIDEAEAVTLARDLDKTSDYVAEQIAYAKDVLGMQFEMIVVLIFSEERQGVTEGELNYIKEGFQKFDKDGNASISAVELSYESTNSANPMTEAQALEAIKRVDKNANNTTEFDEYLKMMIPFWEAKANFIAFRRDALHYDVNGNGLITSTELLSSEMPGYTEADILEEIRNVDANGDDKLGFIELYVKMFY